MLNYYFAHTGVSNIKRLVRIEEPDEEDEIAIITFNDKEMVLTCTLVNNKIDFTKPVEIEISSKDIKYFCHINTNIHLCGYGRLQFLASPVINYMDLWFDDNIPRLSEKVIILYKIGDFYNGYINERFERHGNGVILSSHNDEHMPNLLYGRFENNKCIKNTNYKIIYNNKKLYIGHINEKYQRHGVGALYDSKGNVLQDGIFINNNFVFDDNSDDIGDDIYKTLNKDKRSEDIRNMRKPKLSKSVEEIGQSKRRKY